MLVACESGFWLAETSTYDSQMFEMQNLTKPIDVAETPSLLEAREPTFVSKECLSFLVTEAGFSSRYVLSIRPRSRIVGSLYPMVSQSIDSFVNEFGGRLG